MKKYLWIFSSAFLVQTATAHEGHGIPGALPPALHGGVVEESKHEEGDEHGDHKHAEGEPEESELFFEAVYEDKEIKVFPLSLPEGDNPMFQALSPMKEFSQVAMRIEFPRLKRTEVVKPTIQADSIRVPFDAKKVNRFIIYVTVVQNGEEKEASIQVENE